MRIVIEAEPEEIVALMKGIGEPPLDIDVLDNAFEKSASATEFQAQLRHYLQPRTDTQA